MFTYHHRIYIYNGVVIFIIMIRSLKEKREREEKKMSYEKLS